VTARVRRIGLSAETELEAGPALLHVSATTWIDRFRSGNAFAEGFDRSVPYADLAGAASVTRGDLELNARVGIHSDAGRSFTSASAEAAYGVFRASARTAGLRSSWMDRAGFGSLSDPLPDVPASRLDALSLEVRIPVGPFVAAATAFYESMSDALVWSYDRNSEETRAAVVGGSVETTGVSAELAFRSRHLLGIYALIRPTLLNRSASGAAGAAGPGTGPAAGGSLAAADDLTASIPEFSVSGRLGIRVILFQGDLDLDISGRFYYWDSMQGLRLDPRTGLLMLPLDGERFAPSSWTMDVVAEAGVRTASIFLAYENLVSGTTSLVGNLHVPDYPLPAQRFRFGVFWPISN
jgi:hypothetical protein